MSPEPPEGTRSPPEIAELTDDELIDRVAHEIVDRRLAAPAVFLLESSKPISFIASQGLVFLGPFVDAALSVPQYEAFCTLIEDRENVEKLIVRLEELEDERLTGEKSEKERNESHGEEAPHGPDEG